MRFNFLSHPLLLVVTIALVSFVYFLSKERQREIATPLVWDEYALESKNEPGYLVLLQNLDQHSFAYISLDKNPVSESIFLGEGWEIELLSEGELWNPRICSKVPTVITPDGDIYMYEIRRGAGGMYDSYVTWFDHSTNSISEFNIGSGKFIGKSLFLDSRQNPYFIIENEGSLWLTLIDRNADTLVQKRIKQLKKSEGVTATVSNEQLPILEVYDSKTFSTKKLTLQNNSLVEFTGDSKNNLITYPDEIHALHNLKNGFVATYRLDGPYETNVLYYEKVVLEFVPEEKIYSYIIGSFTQK
jgi:hypothetical protein